MYKAIHAQTGEEIIILNPYWLKRIDHLRGLDCADDLVCQGCRQPLRVKAGEVKRPHFAHKHLKACSYGTESPEILNARAVLYGWLLRQFGQDGHFSVTVEKPMEGLPRPVDCWVSTETSAFAYWIVEAGIKLEPREAIRAALDRPGLSVNYVFLQSMLNEEKKELHSLLLTPTERAFLQASPYDPLFTGPGAEGRTLHYLDAGEAILTSYRGLVLFHAPNWYKGVKKTSPLALVQAGRVDGGFYHPGEGERLHLFHRKQRSLEEKRARYQEREALWESRLAAHRLKPGDAWQPNLTEAERETQGQQGSGPLSSGPLPCVICGQITADYWSTFTDDSGRRLCRCRECLERES